MQSHDISYHMCSHMIDTSYHMCSHMTNINTLVGESTAGLFTGEVTGETVLVAKETAGRRDTGIFPTQVPVVLASAIMPTSTTSSSEGGREGGRVMSVR